MNEVIRRLKESYPIYADRSDEELTVALGRKYPVYLQHEDFRSDFEKLTGETKEVETKPVTEITPTPPEVTEQPKESTFSERRQQFIQENKAFMERKRKEFTEQENLKMLVNFPASINYVGRIIGGFFQDVAAGRVFPTPSRGIVPDLQATGAAIMGKEAPLDELTPLQKGAISGTESMPVIATGMMLAYAGVPMPAAFGTVTAATELEKGTEPMEAAKQAGIAMLIPGEYAVGKEMGARTFDALVKKGVLSAENATARAAIEAGSGAAMIAAIGEAEKLPEYLQADNEQRWNMVMSAIGQQMAFLPMIIADFSATKGEQLRINQIEESAKKVGPATEAAVKREVVTEKPVLGETEAEIISELKTTSEQPKGGEVIERQETQGQKENDVLTEQAPPAETKQEFTGMGGAVPSEFSPLNRQTTGVKNASVDQQRQQRGLEPIMGPSREADPVVWDRVMARIDREPGWQDSLIEELSKKTRTVSADETLALEHRYVDYRNERDKAIDSASKAYEDGRTEDVKDAQAQISFFENKIGELEQILKSTGTELGRGLRMRRAMMREDFSDAGMQRRLRAAKGFEPLSFEELTKIKELSDEIQNLQTSFEEREALFNEKISKMEADLELARIASEIKPAYSPEVLGMAEKFAKFMDSEADKARARLKERLTRMSALVDPTILSDLAIIGASKLTRGAISKTKWISEMVSEFGEWFKEHAEQVFALSKEKEKSKVNEWTSTLDKQSKKKAAKATKAIQGSVEEKQNIVGKISDKIQNNQLDAVSIFVQKLARFYVSQGANREQLVDLIWDDLKSIDSRITRRDAMDAISGYGKYKRLRKDEISVRLRDYKGQLQQIAKIEDIQEKGVFEKTGLERRIPTRAESKLIQKVNQLKREYNVGTLDALKKRLGNNIADLEERLKEKNFTRKRKAQKTISMDEEAMRLKAKQEELKVEFNRKVLEEELKKRKLPKKILDGILESINLVRSQKSSLDFSAFGRQGFAMLLMHPATAVKNLIKTVPAFFSQKTAMAMEQGLKHRENATSGLYERSRLRLVGLNELALSRQEELFRGRWAEKLPWIRASNRAFALYLDLLRADAFDMMWDKVSNKTPEAARAIASGVNILTGYGEVGKFGQAVDAASHILWAPRLILSRAQTLAGQPIWQAPREVRSQFIKDYGKALAGIAVLYGLARAAGYKVEDDPRSSDFGKLKLGRTRIDPLAGHAQVIVFLSREAMRETKTTKGQIRSLTRPEGGKLPYGWSNASDVAKRFIQTKLTPFWGSFWNAMDGENVVGEPWTWQQEIKESVIPLSIMELQQVMEEQGVPRGTAIELLSILGFGVQYYENEPVRSRPGG